MSFSYASHLSAKATPQSEPIPGKVQVQNSAGGFVFQIDDWDRLDRFLILGSEKGTYYASEKKLTIANAECVKRCLQIDAARTVARIVEVSTKNLAPKNDPAIFALGLALSTQPVSPLAYEAIHEVCRIGTHLFQLAEACNSLRGWGRGLRRAFSEWYTRKRAEDMAYQCVKYQSRNGWSHKDVMHLCHLRAQGDNGQIQRWVEKGEFHLTEGSQGVNQALLIVSAFETAKTATNEQHICSLIRDYNLPRECVPTQFLNSPAVWEALLEKMPMTAMIRNLGKMTSVGLLAPMSSAVGKVLGELGSTERLHKSRIHPMAVLTALKTYALGRGMKGHNTRSPVQQIVDALDGAFYKAFDNVESTGKRWLLALDVSGSMSRGVVAGVEGLTPRVASSAMALVTAATEPQHHFMAFSNNFIPLNISPRMRIDDVCRYTERMPFSGTDCSLPMTWALANNVPVDVFAIFTDNETWSGGIHPVQALTRYRNQMGINAKVAVVGMTATEFSIADQNDKGMLDVVGFDASAPAVMSQFARA